MRKTFAQKTFDYYGGFEKPLAEFIGDLQAICSQYPGAIICYDQFSDDIVHLWIETRTES